MSGAPAVAVTMRDDAAFREASQRVEQIEDEIQRLEAELATLDAATRQPNGLWRGASALADAARALDGSEAPQTHEHRAELVRRLDLMRRAMPAAIEARYQAARSASAAYMRGQAPRVVVAFDKLVQGFEQLVAASELFDAVRKDAAALGFDSEVGGVPAGADLPFREYAQHWSCELRKELTSLRERTSLATERDKIAAALACIPPDLGRDDRVRIALAVYDGLGDAGADLWLDWASGRAKPDRSGDQFVWQSCRKRGAITVDALYGLAKSHCSTRGREAAQTPAQGTATVAALAAVRTA